jgi:hypothetical protein
VTTPLIVLSLVVLAPLSAQQRRPARTKPAAPATAPAPAKPATEWPVLSLSVEGARLHAPAKILEVAGVKVGQLAGREVFESARARLQQSGYFDSVGFKYDPVPGKNGIAAVFQVSEIQQTLSWRIEELPIAPDEAAKLFASAEPLYGERLPASEIVFRRLALVLSRRLAGMKREEEIVHRVVSADTGSGLVLVFRPRVPPPSIGVVNFSGSKIWDEGSLRLQINNLAIGAHYAEQRFREYLETTIRPMFEARGRLRVTFPQVTSAPLTEAKGVAVNVTIDDGPEFKLNQVKVEGVPLPPEEIERLGEFGEGDTADFSKIGRGVTRILDKLKAGGYLKPQYKLLRKLNDADKTVDAFFTCTPGGRYTMGKLTIKGLDIISEPVIRKTWAIEPGQPFNNTYPQYFLDRIREDRVFDGLGKTKHEVTLDDASLTANVILTFLGAERPEGERKKQL